jgi:hypothetical protein
MSDLEALLKVLLARLEKPRRGSPEYAFIIRQLGGRRVAA